MQRFDFVSLLCDKSAAASDELEKYRSVHLVAGEVRRAQLCDVLPVIEELRFWHHDFELTELLD